ncbi:MAG: GTPase ObgE [Candidatus Omnitrophota bacterium]
MLIDHAKIYIKAGDGGRGCTSFYRDRAVRKGKPNGGDGGDGGSVIFKVDSNIHTLLDFQYRRHFRAERGGHGGSSDMNGRSGGDLYIRVPAGTILKDAATGLILRDLTGQDEEVVVLYGGKGGQGNSKKREATPGGEGEEKEILLELKIIADVGIIGYPNVGKSTLISRISRAKSKIACYPFTTKEPILGIVDMHDENFTFADMPGLLEGAHEGRGLGDEFLRHIERTKVLLHVIDIAEVEGRNAYEDYLRINKELELYGRRVRKKPQIVACNKIDLAGAKENLKEIETRIECKVYPISALDGSGIDALLEEVRKVVRGGG